LVSSHIYIKHQLDYVDGKVDTPYSQRENYDQGPEVLLASEDDDWESESDDETPRYQKTPARPIRQEPTIFDENTPTPKANKFKRTMSGGSDEFSRQQESIPSGQQQQQK
jgi:hypothetical protein